MPRRASTDVPAELAVLRAQVRQLDQRVSQITTKRKHRPNDMMLPKSIGPDLIDLESFMPADSVMPIVPVAGQLWRYPTGINGVNWLFQWSANDGVWYFIGGAPAIDNVTTSENTITNTTYEDLTTTGPTITIPFDGYYSIQCGCIVSGHVAAGGTFTAKMGYSIGGGAVSSAKEASLIIPSDTENVLVSPVAVSLIAATGTVTAKYYGTTGIGTSTTWRNRWLSITPILVSP